MDSPNDIDILAESISRRAAGNRELGDDWELVCLAFLNRHLSLYSILAKLVDKGCGEMSISEFLKEWAFLRSDARRRSKAKSVD